MQSLFAKTKQLPGATAQPAVEETYNLAGLNFRDPDEIMPPGESPYTTNSRMYARNDGEQRVANRTRMGAGFLSTPVGQTLDTQNVGSSGLADYAFGTLGDGSVRIVAEPFVCGTTGSLTRVDIELKKSASATGHVIVEIRTDSAGLPSQTILGQGSILGNLLTTSYAYYPAYFIDAPALTSGTTYWIVTYIQDNGTNYYYVDQNTGTSGKSSADGGMSWGAAGGNYRFKTYISTAGQVRGWGLRYPSDATKNTILIAQHGNVYSVPKATGTPVLLDSTLTDATGPVRFTQWNDLSIWVDGTINARQYDGTTVTTISGGIPNTPSNVWIWQNRMFVLTLNNRIDFSDLLIPGATPTWTSTNFFYIGAPKTADHVTAGLVFQDKFVFFTKETKYVVTGSDITTFTIKQAVGTKGAASQEGMDADRNFIYFIGADKQIYAFNGVADTLLSDKVQPELTTISDITKVRIHVYRNQVRIYYPRTPSTTNNYMLLYDLVLKEWMMDTNHQVNGSADLYLDDDELIEFSSLVGQIFYGESQYSDLGRKLEWRYWTNYRTYAYRRRNGQTFGGALSLKRIKRFRPIVRTESAAFNMSVGKDFDFANSPDMFVYLIDAGGAKWGSFVWDDGSKWGPGVRQVQNRATMSGRGHFIQYRFERSGVETPVELYGFASMYKIGKQR